jgi:polyphosphate kinase
MSVSPVTKVKSPGVEVPDGPTPIEDKKAAYDLHDPALYINRELSLLEFNRRVLEEAQDEQNPILERAKFLAIYSSNMDEFFMVRVAGLRQQIAARVTDTPADGLSPAEQLVAIRKIVRARMKEMHRCYQDIQAKLSEAGVYLHHYEALNESQQQGVNDYFNHEVFPVLTPLAFDPGRPFPHISSLSLNLAVLVRNPDDGVEYFARIKVPDTLPRLVAVRRAKGDSKNTYRFVWVEDLIAHNLADLFPGFEIVEKHMFRITRNADFEIEGNEAGDLLETIEANVRRRRFGFVVRLTEAPDIPEEVRWA